MKISLLIVATLLSGCSTVEYITVDLSGKIPPPLVLPVVKAEELECVSDETFKKLDIQNTLRKQRIITLENIIKSTGNPGQPSAAE